MLRSSLFVSSVVVSFQLDYLIRSHPPTSPHCLNGRRPGSNSDHTSHVTLHLAFFVLSVLVLAQMPVTPSISLATPRHRLDGSRFNPRSGHASHLRLDPSLFLLSLAVCTSIRLTHPSLISGTSSLSRQKPPPLKFCSLIQSSALIDVFRLVGCSSRIILSLFSDSTSFRLSSSHRLLSTPQISSITRFFFFSSFRRSFLAATLPFGLLIRSHSIASLNCHVGWRHYLPSIHSVDLILKPLFNVALMAGHITDWQIHPIPRSMCRFWSLTCDHCTISALASKLTLHPSWIASSFAVPA